MNLPAIGVGVEGLDLGVEQLGIGLTIEDCLPKKSMNLPAVGVGEGLELGVKKFGIGLTIEGCLPK